MKPDCESYAFKLLARRDYFEQELALRLAEKGFTEEEISATLDKLRQMGLLNDDKLAADYALYLARSKNKSDFAILQKLRARRVPERVAQAAVQSCSEQLPEPERIGKLLPKLAHGLDMDQRRFELISKIKAKLARRGFSFDAIEAASVDGFVDELFETQQHTQE